MKILIVGGGVAGPALALFLKGSAEITLVDKAPAWGNIGYAITLWGNGQKMLKELDVDHTILKQGYEIPWNTFENKKGEILKITTFDVFRSYGPTIVVTRAALQQALTKDLKDFTRIKMGTTVTNIVQNEHYATVTLSDGTTENFDLVVGADGIHSQIREMVFGKDFLKYYGWHFYTFWIPPKFAPPKGIIEFSSGGKMCTIYPMEDRAVVTLLVASNNTVLDKNENTKEVLSRVFFDFKDIVEHLIDAIEDPTHVLRDNLAHVDMKEWYKGRVVLMGDAQHATSPLTGMGSSMAMEDAFVLAEELKANNMQNITLSLERYQQRRSVRIKRFRRASHVVESWMMVKSPFFSAIKDFLIKFIPVSYFTRSVEKVLQEEI